jgi:hypothetical protein
MMPVFWGAYSVVAGEASWSRSPKGPKFIQEFWPRVSLVAAGRAPQMLGYWLRYAEALPEGRILAFVLSMIGACDGIEN